MDPHTPLPANNVDSGIAIEEHDIDLDAIRGRGAEIGERDTHASGSLLAGTASSVVEAESRRTSRRKSPKSTAIHRTVGWMTERSFVSHPRTTAIEPPKYSDNVPWRSDGGCRYLGVAQE